MVEVLHTDQAILPSSKMTNRLSTFTHPGPDTTELYQHSLEEEAFERSALDSYESISTDVHLRSSKPTYINSNIISSSLIN